MDYNILEIAKIVQGTVNTHSQDRITEIAFDTRLPANWPKALFVALEGPQANGHFYLEKARELGCQAFLVSSSYHLSHMEGYIAVDSPLAALQTLAAHHRSLFQGQVLGITGSLGKTTVKEWLYQLISPDIMVSISPKSYNSQLGVAISLLSISLHHEVAIIEAGISEPGEMRRLEQMMRPTIGLLTNLGDAHQANFESHLHKLKEKCSLFTRCPTVVCSSSQTEHFDALKQLLPQAHIADWGFDAGATIPILPLGSDRYALVYQGERLGFDMPRHLPFQMENLFHCLVLGLLLGIEPLRLLERLQGLKPLPMRLEIKHGKNGMLLLNDSYSAEFLSLHLALQHLSRAAGSQAKALIVSQFHDQQVSPADFLYKLRVLVGAHHLSKLVIIGPDIPPSLKGLDPCRVDFYPSVELYLSGFPHTSLAHMAVLIKGARRYGFERIVAHYQDKTGRTCLEINLSALRDNYLWFRHHLGSETKIMVVLKALGYGAGSFELARMLQSVQAHYLAVAYIDEAVLLRRHGIRTPIMVLGPEPEGLHLLLEHALEPEVFSPSSLQVLLDFVKNKEISEPLHIHLNIETGMHRTGFAFHEIEHAIAVVNQQTKLKIASIFTHLAASDDPSSDAFTNQQLLLFNSAVALCKSALSYPFLTHVANTAAAGRWPSSPFHMVRLGIGFYGIDPSGVYSQHLRLAFRWVTQINQVHQVPQGHTVGYGRAYRAAEERTIATVPVGYADGLRRSLGQGRACLYHRGIPAPIVGKICMDMTMIDVTGLGAAEGDEVVIFETLPQLENLCLTLETIPYEIFTGISGRVRRVYLEE